MDLGEISLKLESLFRELFNDDGLEISDNMSANDIEEWDSLKNVILFIEIEKLFHVRFDTSEMTQTANVGELIKSIQHKLLSE